MTATTRLAAGCLCILALFTLGADKPAAEAEPKFEMFEADEDGRAVIFNRKDLTGWDADPKYWRVENGEIVGQCKDKSNPYSYCVTKKAVGDFRLVFQVKLTPNEGNSGVQVRSVKAPADKGGEHMKGPQCDIGKGWWGHLYDEHGLGKMTKKGAEEAVLPGQWNIYEIVAQGTKVRRCINGTPAEDVDDARLRQVGLIGLQIHSGGPMEIRFKEMRLEINPKDDELTTARR